MKITIDIPDKWDELKKEQELSWRHILRLGIREVEHGLYKQSGNKGIERETGQDTF